jgi:hypothetical protein
VTTPDDPDAGQPTPEQPPTPPQQPAYYGQPPAPYYYGPPAPTQANRGVWFAIGAGSMFVLGLVGSFGLFLIPGLFFFSEPNFDNFDEGDYEAGYSYYVDQQSVVDAVEVPCNKMLDAGDQIKFFTDPDKAAVTIKAFAVTAQEIADAIGTASPNRDSKLWRADWEKLAHNLQTYATDLTKVGNDAGLDTFAEMGEAPIMVRMADSSNANCEIPEVVVALDPENANYYEEYGKFESY